MRTRLRKLKLKKWGMMGQSLTAIALALTIVSCGTDVDVGKNALRNGGNSGNQNSGGLGHSANTPPANPFDFREAFDQTKVNEIESALLENEQSCYGNLPNIIKYFCSESTKYHSLFSEEMELFCGRGRAKMTDQFPDYGRGTCGWTGKDSDIDSFYRSDEYTDLVETNKTVDPNDDFIYWRHLGFYSMILEGNIKELRDTFFMAVEDPDRYAASGFAMPDGTTVTPLPSQTVEDADVLQTTYKVSKKATDLASRSYGDTGYVGITDGISHGERTIFIFDYSVSDLIKLHLRRSAMILYQRAPGEVILLVSERDHLAHFNLVSRFAGSAMVKGDKARMKLLKDTAKILKSRH